MAEPAASQRGRISALLRSLPSATAFRLAEAAGLFAPLAPLIDHEATVDRAERDPESGRIAASSLPAIWKWISDVAAPSAAGGFIEAFARAAFGSGLTPASLGIVFSAFSWSYALLQIPGGVFLDRFGTRTTYTLALTLWFSFRFFRLLSPGRERWVGADKCRAWASSSTAAKSPCTRSI